MAYFIKQTNIPLPPPEGLYENQKTFDLFVLERRYTLARLFKGGYVKVEGLGENQTIPGSQVEDPESQVVRPFDRLRLCDLPNPQGAKRCVERQDLYENQKTFDLFVLERRYTLARLFKGGYVKVEGLHENQKSKFLTPDNKPLRLGYSNQLGSLVEDPEPKVVRPFDRLRLCDLPNPQGAKRCVEGQDLYENQKTFDLFVLERRYTLARLFKGGYVKVEGLHENQKSKFLTPDNKPLRLGYSNQLGSLVEDPEPASPALRGEQPKGETNNKESQNKFPSPDNKPLQLGYSNQLGSLVENPESKMVSLSNPPASPALRGEQPKGETFTKIQHLPTPPLTPTQKSPILTFLCCAHIPVES